jgi:hypothetical protein
MLSPVHLLQALQLVASTLYSESDQGLLLQNHVYLRLKNIMFSCIAFLLLEFDSMLQCRINKRAHAEHSLRFHLLMDFTTKCTSVALCFRCFSQSEHESSKTHSIRWRKLFPIACLVECPCTSQNVRKHNADPNTLNLLNFGFNCIFKFHSMWTCFEFSTL